MKVAAFCLGLCLLFVGFRAPLDLVPTLDTGQNLKPATSSGGTGVRTTIQNVDLHLTDRVIVHIASLRGILAATKGDVPVFDDKESFGLTVDAASITVNTTALSNDLNDYVFADPKAPLKKLTATIHGNELAVKGVLANKGGIPFETTGTLALTPEGFIRVHTTKVSALHLPVKGLMDLLGVDTANLINTSKVEGVTIDKNDLILDPLRILPPPQMHGHVTGIQLRNETIILTFGSPQKQGKAENMTSSCGGRNFLAFKGGTLRFGKLTMSNTDLEMIDSAPADPFDFSIEHYKDQLMAGYSKTTRGDGLCVHMPDFGKLKQARNPR